MGGAGGPTATGWGQRLKQQEQEEEKAIADEEEQLRKALAMSMDIDAPAGSSATGQSKPAAATTKPPPVTAAKNTKEIDPVNAAWPKIKNPELGTLAASSTKPTSSPSKSEPSKAPSVASRSPASTSGGPSTAAVVPAIPAGPGHKLGDGSTTARGRTRPGSATQPPTDDPQEIRRRRMAFLDKLQKSPPADQER